MAMRSFLFRVRGIFALLCAAPLAGCIDSAQPILTDAQPLLGDRLHLQFYSVRDDGAHEPMEATFVWRGGRYVATSITGMGVDIGDFTLHVFEGTDLIVQSVRPNKPTEYAIARKLAAATYLVVAIDETYADDATRGSFCSSGPGIACRVATSEAVIAFARATAAKPLASGGLAVLLADD
jgi:hypothetical protein